MVEEILAGYPYFDDQVAGLVEAHHALVDEPLQLAIYYEPSPAEKDVFLFEILENFGDNRVDDRKELFEIEFGGSTDFPLDNGRRLHLVLTNPVECDVAISEDWESIRPIRQAIRDQRANTIFATPVGERLRSVLGG